MSAVGEAKLKDPCRQLCSHVIFCHHHRTISVHVPYMAVLDFESGKALYMHCSCSASVVPEPLLTCVHTIPCQDFAYAVAKMYCFVRGDLYM